MEDITNSPIVQEQKTLRLVILQFANQAHADH
jgi:hypothetical protein